MDYIFLQEALRINCLAMYNLLPNLPAPLINLVLPEMARLTFKILELDLLLKLS